MSFKLYTWHLISESHSQCACPVTLSATNSRETVTDRTVTPLTAHRVCDPRTRPTVQHAL